MTSVLAPFPHYVSSSPFCGGRRARWQGTGVVGLLTNRSGAKGASGGEFTEARRFTGRTYNWIAGKKISLKVDSMQGEVCQSERPC